MAVVVTYWPNQDGTGSDRSPLGGPLGPTDTGWEWRYAGWVLDTVAGSKGAIEVRVETLNSDTLTQVRNKILAALKAASQQQGFTPTLAIPDPMNAPITIP